MGKSDDRLAEVLEKLNGTLNLLNTTLKEQGSKMSEFGQVAPAVREMSQNFRQVQDGASQLQAERKALSDEMIKSVQRGLRSDVERFSHVKKEKK